MHNWNIHKVVFIIIIIIIEIGLKSFGLPTVEIQTLLSSVGLSNLCAIFAPTEFNSVSYSDSNFGVLHWNFKISLPKPCNLS